MSAQKKAAAETTAEKIVSKSQIYAAERASQENFIFLPAYILKLNISLVARCVLTIILRFSNRKCYASNRWFSELVGVSERTIKRAVKELKENNFIAAEYPSRKSRIIKMSDKMTLIMRDKLSNMSDKMTLDEGQNVTITKDSITKDSNIIPGHKKTVRVKHLFPDTSIEIILSKLLLSKILEIKPDFKKPDLQKWAKNIDRMIRLDKRTPERIKAVIRWCQNDDFWQKNILSTKNLRKHFDRLEMRMQKSDSKSKTRFSRELVGNSAGNDEEYIR